MVPVPWEGLIWLHLVIGPNCWDPVAYRIDRDKATPLEDFDHGLYAVSNLSVRVYEIIFSGFEPAT